MRIYRMTATFGKLEHETLTLEPGLNLIEAPNEWGKTTWSAFLMTMLYGLATGARSKKTALADKEKYAPWSGSPMAGRIDLCWNGRDITIERRTKGRTPLGIFQAYETQSGLAVPELTAANCGELLLGVEQTVYRNTGFIRQSDMPVAQDDALRRRLNALVTTGDETGEGDALATELKALKNKCRFNRSGLLPQAEAQRRELEAKLDSLETLQTHSRNLRERLGETKSWIQALENHRDALRYADAERNARRMAEARERRDQAEEAMTALEGLCGKQPPREQIAARIQAIQAYRETEEQYRQEEANAATPPEPPAPPELLRGMSLEQAEEQVRQDIHRHGTLSVKKTPWILLLAALICLGTGLFGIIIEQWPLTALLAGGIVLLALGLRYRSVSRRERELLERKYGSPDPVRWQALLDDYRAEKAAYDRAMLAYRTARGDLDIRRTALQKQREALFGSHSPEKVMGLWQKMEKNWELLETAKGAFQQAERHLQDLQGMTQEAAKKPVLDDALTYSPEKTRQLLAEAQEEKLRLENRLAEYRGKMEALGDSGALQAQLRAVEERIGKLENIYKATVLALDTLAQARQELQRRFAPRISRRAQELLGKLTGGRYDRLTLSQDLSLLTAAGQEETLREVLWRSDGTIDQLYLALRLAVAEELTPQAPLVLDDAFVRFDDTRLQAALDILEETAKERQVILFTCQHREQTLLQKK